MLTWVCSIIDHRWRQKVAREAPSVSLMFLPQFDAFCDLLLNRRTAVKKLARNVDYVIYVSVLQKILSKNQSHCQNNLT